MFGYGALLNNSFGEQLKNTLDNCIHVLEGIPLYWYIVALILLVISIKLLLKK